MRRRQAGLSKLIAAVTPRTAIIEEPAARLQSKLQQHADVVGIGFIGVNQVGALHLGERRIAGQVGGESLHILILVIGLIGLGPVGRRAEQQLTSPATAKLGDDELAIDDVTGRAAAVRTSIPPRRKLSGQASQQIR